MQKVGTLIRMDCHGWTTWYQQQMEHVQKPMVPPGSIPNIFSLSPRIDSIPLMLIVSATTLTGTNQSKWCLESWDIPPLSTHRTKRTCTQGTVSGWEEGNASLQGQLWLNRKSNECQDRIHHWAGAHLCPNHTEAACVMIVNSLCS